MYILQRKQHYFSEIMGNCNEVAQLLIYGINKNKDKCENILIPPLSNSLQHHTCTIDFYDKYFRYIFAVVSE